MMKCSDCDKFLLFTDYFQYSVVWGCNNLPLNRSVESFWVLSRSPTITSPAIRTRVDFLIDTYVERENMRSTEQADAV